MTFRSSRPPTRVQDNSFHLNLQLLRKTRENSTTGFRDDYHIFLTRPADARVIQTRFDCEHLPILENNFLQARMFVDFQTEPMASTVEKSDAPAVAHSGREPATGRRIPEWLCESSFRQRRL